MEVKDFFKQKTIELKELGEGVGYAHSDDLLNLIKNAEVKDYVKNKYQLHDNVEIKLAKIDVLIPVVRKYVDRFKLMRITTTDDKVSTSFTSDGSNDILFTIAEAVLDEVEIDSISATAIYDSVTLFYKGRKLNQYINYLKNSTRDPNLLLSVNRSWQEHYAAKDEKLKSRVFRILHDAVDDGYYLKGINSEVYKEYGVAETFVITILELHRLAMLKVTGFHISAIALSESKIEILLRSAKETKIEDLGYVYPSIAIRNEDQGDTSFGFYSSLEFKLANVKNDGHLYFFPNKKVKNIEIQRTFDHRVTVETFVDSYGRIEDFFHEFDNFKEDFYFLKKGTTPDQLRTKIEEKLVSNRSPFKGIKELKDLFTREKAGHVENLETLLKLCGRAELINMAYDLKFQLRYLISNVLLYGNNKMDGK